MKKIATVILLFSLQSTAADKRFSIPIMVKGSEVEFMLESMTCETLSKSSGSCGQLELNTKKGEIQMRCKERAKDVLKTFSECSFTRPSDFVVKYECKKSPENFPELKGELTGVDRDKAVALEKWKVGIKLPTAKKGEEKKSEEMLKKLNTIYGIKSAQFSFGNCKFE